MSCNINILELAIYLKNNLIAQANPLLRMLIYFLEYLPEMTTTFCNSSRDKCI